MVFDILRKNMTAVGLLNGDYANGTAKVMAITLGYCYFGILISCWITTSWYFIYDVHDPIEFAESSYYTGTTTTIVILYIQISRLKDDFLELFDDLALIVEQSER